MQMRRVKCKAHCCLTPTSVGGYSAAVLQSYNTIATPNGMH